MTFLLTHRIYEQPDRIHSVGPGLVRSEDFVLNLDHVVSAHTKDYFDTDAQTTYQGVQVRLTTGQTILLGTTLDQFYAHTRAPR